jgi:hypothetical protein
MRHATIFFAFPSHISNHDFNYIHSDPEVLRVKNSGMAFTVTTSFMTYYAYDNF